MHFLKLVLRNALRHKLRTGLTVTGLVVATLAFGLLQTVIHAWYAGADVASSSRLVTRHAISLTFQLPVSYMNKIRAIDGVKGVTWSNSFAHLHFEVRIGENTFFSTRTPELWLVPPIGWGVIAGRVMNTGGQPISNQMIIITNPRTE